MRRRCHLAMRSVIGIALVALPAACSVGRPDLDQYARMQQQSASERTHESINCHARDLLCARLVELRGEACAQTANDAALPPAEQERRRQCAMADAQTIPELVPANADPADQANAALLVLDAWRAARSDPAATTEALQRAVATLDAMPGGAPYARTLAADTVTFDVLTNRVPAGQACARLRAARQTLPAGTTGSLADRVAAIGTAIDSTMARRGCPR